MLNANFIFLSYYPLKQGLKRNTMASNKHKKILFLSYYPLKQGLKPSISGSINFPFNIIFILLSIKTRIETQ